MTVNLTWQTVVTAGAVVGALVTIITLLVKLVHWVDRQKEQDTDIKNLRVQHEADMKDLKEAQERQQKAIQAELTLICYGLRGALQGLIETGCNGPCKAALDKMDKHLNQAAHGETEK